MLKKFVEIFALAVTLLSVGVLVTSQISTQFYPYHFNFQHFITDARGFATVVLLLLFNMAVIAAWLQFGWKKKPRNRTILV